MRSHFRVSLYRLTIYMFISLLFSTQAVGFNVDVDGVLDDVIYTRVLPLKSEIGRLYLVPMSDAVYIGAEVDDANTNVADP